MNSSILSDLDEQIHYAQEAILLSNSIRDKVVSLESEKNEALKKCALLEAKIKRMKEEKCSNCTILLKKLTEERKERQKLKQQEATKILKTIAKTLENMEDGSTNQMTNAQQIFTQLGFGGEDNNQGKSKIKLIEDKINIDDDDSASNIFEEDTIIEVMSEDSSDNCIQETLIVVPETEMQSECKNNVKSKQVRSSSNLKENRITLEEESDGQQINKKPKCEEVVNENTSKPKKRLPNVYPGKSLLKNHNEKSPSVLIPETLHESRNGNIASPDKQAQVWKMKPSFVVDGGVDITKGKKMKQMTLSLSRPEKKHDISLSGGFKGGITLDSILPSDEEKDVVLPSPERASKNLSNKKSEACETLEDPDLTVFQPNAASTCLPLETSFDKIPDKAESPPYKYRRETVRKKEKRMKLPGQDCDECAKYYKAAGLDKTQDLKARMDACSRHRDKYQIRAHTPPGFWDPVFPISPEER